MRQKMPDHNRIYYSIFKGLLITGILLALSKQSFVGILPAGQKDRNPLFRVIVKAFRFEDAHEVVLFIGVIPEGVIYLLADRDPVSFPICQKMLRILIFHFLRPP